MNMLYNLRRINEVCREHVENNFLPLPEAHVRDFQAVRGAVDTLFADTLDMMANGELETVNLLRRHCDEIKDIISDTYHNLHYQLREGDARSMTVLYVYLNTLQETQEMVSAMRKFLRITGKVNCIQDPHMQAVAAAMMNEEDLVFIISYSGATKDNLQVAKLAKESGAKVAAISHFMKSPLTAYCDAVLLCGAKEGPLDGGSMSAKLGQLYLIDLLYQGFYERNMQECMENNQKASSAVMEKLL